MRYANGNTESSKAYALVAFGSRRFTAGRMSLTMFTMDFFAMLFTFDEFGHVFWGMKKPKECHEG